MGIPVVGKGIVLGAVVAAGGLLLLPGVAAAVGRAGRPVARAALKTGATAFVEFRKAGAEVYEHLEDLAAEIQAEMRNGQDAGDKTAEAKSAPRAAKSKTG
jgi:hypothetical protein